MPNTFNRKTTEFADAVINNYSSQGILAITGLNNGGFVMTFIRGDGSSNGDGVYLQSYDANGNQLNNVALVNTFTYGDQNFPSIASLNNGGFAVVWQSSSYQSGIYLQIYDANSHKSGSETMVSDNISDYRTNHRNPSIASLNNGGFAVVWQSFADDTNIDVYLQRYNADGSKLGVETRVNTNIFNGQEDPSVSSLSNGGFVVVWRDSASGLNICLQRYDQDGNKLGQEVMVSGDANSLYYSPSVTNLSGGRFIVGWRVYGENKFYLQTYDVNANKVGEGIEINIYDTGYQDNLSITKLKDGGFIVTWRDYEEEGGEYKGIYLQRYDTNGNLLTTRLQVNSYTGPSTIASYSVTALNDGGWIIIWQSDIQDGLDWGIRGQRFNSRGEKILLLPSNTPTQSSSISGSGTSTRTITSTNSITPSPSPSPALNIQNLNQSLSFNQIDSQITFPLDITINPISPTDQFKVTMTLKKKGSDGVERIFDDESQLIIQQASMENGVGSEFVNGTLAAIGNAEQVNSFLTDLKIDIGDEFLDPQDDINNIFAIDIEVTDKTHNQVKTGRTTINYQCLALPEELIKAVEDQRNSEGKALVMDFIRYFNNPQDLRFQRAISNLTQILDDITLNNPNRTLSITQLNQTAFEIFGPDMNDNKLSFEVEGYCREVIGRNFKLNPQLIANSDTTKSSSLINIPLFAGIGGGALLLTALTCLTYKGIKNHNARKAEEVRRVEAERVAQETRQEEARRAEQERIRRQEAERIRRAEQEKRQEEARRREAERVEQERQEQVRREAEEKRAEAIRKAEEARRAEQARRQEEARKAQEKQREEEAKRRQEQQQKNQERFPPRPSKVTMRDDQDPDIPIYELASKIIELSKQGKSGFEILDVKTAPGASEEEKLKAARTRFLRLSKKLHPDKTSELSPRTITKTTVAFQIINNVNEKINNK